MNEQIDVSQHLRRGESVVNPFRAAKGDLDGKVTGEGTTRRIAYAEVVDKTIARGLISKGFLEPYHFGYGVRLLEMRQAYFAPLEGNTGVFGHSGTGQAAEMYKAITFALGPENISRMLAHIKAVLRAVDQDVDYATDVAAHCIAGIEAYRQSFDLIMKIMDDERDKRREQEVVAS